MIQSPFRRLLHRVLLWSGPVLLVLVGVFQIAVWLSEKLWFESLGYGAHFNRLFAWRAGSFVAGAVLFGAWLGFNVHIAWRNSARRSVPLSFFQSDDAARLIPLEDKLHLDRYRRRATVLILAALSWAAGLGFSARYDLFLRAFSLQSTGLRDNASGFDLAFFLFALPFYAWLNRFLLVCLVTALALSLAIYVYEEAIGARAELASALAPANAPRASRAAAKHLATLWAMLLLWQGVNCLLSVPASFVSGGGAAARVFDPLDISWGWTTAGLFALSAPLLALLSGLSLARELRPRIWIAGLVWMVSASVLPALLPLVVPRDAANPAWTSALSRHIESTRRAWGLDDVAPRSLAAASNQPFRAVSTAPDGFGGAAPGSPESKEEIRAPLPLWPASAAQGAFNRQLEARGESARVHRVWLERVGRDLVYCALAMPPRPDSGSWRAQHERGAREGGRGLWMQMEASRALRGGGPIFRSQTPAPAWFGAANGATAARRGRVGIGATGALNAQNGDGDEWILARHETGSRGEAETPRGVDLNGQGVKLLLATRFLDPNLARATDENDAVIWHRGAAQRCRELAPFLDWQESDARAVSVPSRASSDGASLQWIVPGVVWTDDYPDSAAPGALGPAPQRANYGRHIAAGVVDAQTGATTLYLLDQNEPYAALYSRVFPELFALPTALPTEIRAQLRPSPTLLRAQTLIWARYHDADPLSWVAHRADYRLLFGAPGLEEIALRPLAASPSGDWSLMAFARPESQVGRGAAPLAAILGADERFFASGGSAVRWCEWRVSSPLALPDILIEPVLITPGTSLFSTAPLLGSVAPRLDARGDARGLVVTSGAVTSAPEAAGASGPLRLQAQIRISGAADKAASSAPRPTFVAPEPRLETARAAWLEVRAARSRGDWEGVASAEKRLDAALGIAPREAETGTR